MKMNKKARNVVNIPDGVENLLWSVYVWNDRQEPELKLLGDALSATMTNGIVIVFQPMDDQVEVQGYTLSGQKLNVSTLKRDDYKEMEKLLHACHAA